MTYFSKIYKEKLVPDLMQKHSIENIHRVPKIEKITVSMGLGADGSDKRLLEAAMNELAAITTRKPAYAKAKKSIASFKLRAGQIIGIYVTLRGAAMYEFIERLVYLTLPRVHDFRGFRKSAIDSSNNFSFGIKDHLVFTELSYDKIAKNRGLNVAITIKSHDKSHTLDLLKGLHFPIK
jgi:large subunit ribosomal protein L5